VLDIRDLTVEYDSGGHRSRALDELSLSAGSGELVLLLGPSGCGKTTLLSILAGILRPTSGTVHLDGIRIDGLKGADLTRHRRHRVGVVFQAFNLVPSLTALENVAAPLWAAGVAHADARARALTLLGQAERARSRPGDLSGGQQQRVAIARALVHDPPLLLPDEPTAHLDHVQVEVVLGILRDLARPGRMVVVATHDERITPLADQVVQLRPDVVHSQTATTVHLRAGELLFSQGERADLVYVVQHGTVAITRDDGADGSLLATYRAGEYFGELGAMLGTPRAGTARAVCDATLLGCSVTELRARLGSGLLFRRPAVTPGPARGRPRAAGRS
jgi:putative ABC transport system ATP-binding protein